MRGTLRAISGAAALLATAHAADAQTTAEVFEQCLKPTPAARRLLARDIRAWRPGRPLPSEAFRAVPSCGCLPRATDSVVLMQEVTNYPFLIALATDRRAEQAVVGLAIERALVLGGPSRTFEDLRARYRADPYLLELPAHRSIHSRMQRRAVWVRGVELEPGAFRREGFGEQQAGVVAMEMARLVRQGQVWETVLARYTGRYARGGCGCSVITDLGSHVVSERREGRGGGVELEVPAYHLPRLLGARPGDALVLTVRPTAWDYTRRSLVVWQVLGQYDPDQPPRRAGLTAVVNRP